MPIKLLLSLPAESVRELSVEAESMRTFCTPRSPLEVRNPRGRCYCWLCMTLLLQSLDIAEPEVLTVTVSQQGVVVGHYSIR